MENSGIVVTSVSMRIDLWNDIQKVISEDEMSFSRFIQSASRLKLYSRKIQRVREIFDLLDDKEMELLKKEIENRNKKNR